MTESALVNVERLFCRYLVSRGLRTPTVVNAVRNVDLDVFEGELIALVGESGSGKSTLGRAIVRLVRPVAGRILFSGVDIAHSRGRDLRRFRGDVQMVFQNPYQSLNPRVTVGDALSEVLAVWGRRRPEVKDADVDGLLTMVHLPAAFSRKYPHELSGGQRQRIAIARAMAVKPRLIVADEPVSALDVSSAAHVLNLLLELKERTNLTCLFITHDIGLARVVADRIAVMHSGKIVEVASSKEVFEAPRDEYTKSLLKAQLDIIVPESPSVPSP
jgi:ABC-type glutathione transport system ATPase component